MKTTQAVSMAVLAALLYAISTPLSKILLASIDPTMLAGLLYLGAGLGVGTLYLARRRDEPRKERLGRSDLPYVLGMISLDILAPILLLKGTQATAAAEVSLLSNFEIAATALIAVLAFHEKLSFRMWAALLLITLSSMILSLDGSASLHFSAGALLILAASFCWGLENNCTRRISARSTYQIVTIKGLCSGTFSFLLALALGARLPGPLAALPALLLGFVSYGLSIFAYIRAQKVIGAARTSAFYALAPFLAAFLSFLLLKERLSAQYAAGLAVMIIGSALAAMDTLQQQGETLHTHTVYHLHGGHLERERVTHTHADAYPGHILLRHHMHPESTEEKSMEKGMRA